MMNAVPNNGRSSHVFSQIPKANIPRSSFNRSHTHKTTFSEGLLVPVFVDEVLPGDTFNLRMTCFARIASPLTYPIMDNLYLQSFFFFVPCRLVWNHWEEFNGQQINISDSTSFSVPIVTAPAMGGVGTGDLYDYMGVPIKVNSLVFNNLLGRSYNLIVNEWFRDQNLQNSLTVDVGDGPDTYANYSSLFRRGKRHDYFTSCLPWPQKVNDGTVITLPLGTSAPVQRVSNAIDWAVYQSGTNTLGTTGYVDVTLAGTLRGGATAYNASLDPNGGLIANLASATSATINQLRQSFQMQKLFERDARGGTRYKEVILVHFGVNSPDQRLQRPEYLGGGQSVINVHTVAQTAPPTATEDNFLGQLGAYATSIAHGHGFTKSFTEHGHIIGLIATRADLTYQQGLNKMWSRQSRYDFYWPVLSHIGEQAVLNKELYCDGSGNDALTFGYQERSAEYRYKPSVISGIFRSTATTPLDAWHLAQDFGSLPTLGSTFIQENAPMSRVKAVTSQPDFIADIFFDLTCARPMPVYGVPGFIDHF